jgi:maleate isomerase
MVPAQFEDRLKPQGTMDGQTSQTASVRDFPASGWSRIGMLTPSSNTTLEPYTSAMLAAFYGRATAHFGRFRVTEISMSEASRTQFETAPILEAARSLADARVDAIAWNGTSAGWLGFDKDEQLCELIRQETGIPATSSMLALNDILARIGASRMALVTPYLSEIQERIIANYRNAGIEIVADRRLEDRGNFSFAEYSPEKIADMVRDVAVSRPDAIAIVCTNFRGAPIVAALEEELGIMVLDSVSVALWATIRLCGLDPKQITGWGRLFREVG